MTNLIIRPVRQAMLLQGVALTAFLAPITGTFAQQQSDDGVNDLIVVTATKRAGGVAIQDVPKALSVLSGDQLERQQVRTLQDISFSVPNVALEPGGSVPSVANFSIRGQGTNSSIPTIEPTVGAFIDGIYLGTNYGVVTDMFDLEAIEILRGPQGLLFGKNVSGGAVLLRSRRPVVGDGFKLRGQAAIESGIEYRLNSSVDFPLGDRAAMKLSAQYADDAGYFENDFDGSDSLGERDTILLRPTIVWQPTDDLDLAFIFEYGSQGGDGGTTQNTGAFGGFQFDIDEEGFADIEWMQATFEANKRINFGDGVITNVAGWRSTESISLTDFDGLSFLGLHAIFGTEAEQFSNELRYAGSFGDIWDLTAGVYYFTQDLSYRERRLIVGGVDATFGGDQDSWSFSAFAQNDIRVFDKLTLNLGLRFSVEEKEAQIANFAVPQNCDSLGESYEAVPCSFNFDEDVDFDRLTPLVGFQYRLDADKQIYGLWKRGFRSGGFNVRNTSAPDSAGPTADEELDGFELGLKTSWMDGDIIFNLASFYNDIDNLQRETNIADPVVGVIQAIRNTANARIVGFEFDGVVDFTNEFSVNFGLGYQDGKYTEVLLDLNGDGVIDAGDRGLELPRLANWSANVAGRFVQAIGSLGDVEFSAAYAYRDTAPFTDSNSAFLSAANLVRASARFTPVGGGYHISVYGRNLLDEAYESTVAPTPFGGFSFVNEGRVIGASIGFEL